MPMRGGLRLQITFVKTSVGSDSRALCLRNCKRSRIVACGTASWIEFGFLVFGFGRFGLLVFDMLVPGTAEWFARLFCAFLV